MMKDDIFLKDAAEYLQTGDVRGRGRREVFVTNK